MKKGCCRFLWLVALLCTSLLFTLIACAEEKEEPCFAVVGDDWAVVESGASASAAMRMRDNIRDAFTGTVLEGFPAEAKYITGMSLQYNSTYEGPSEIMFQFDEFMPESENLCVIAGFVFDEVIDWKSCIVTVTPQGGAVSFTEEDAQDVRRADEVFVMFFAIP